MKNKHILLTFILIYISRSFSDSLKKKLKERSFNISCKQVNLEKIPKICYQTFMSKESLPESINEIITHNKETNPDIDFVFYNNKDCEDYIREHFSSRVFAAYMSINPKIGACKADFWRYCILYKNGGIYLDIKSKLKVNLFQFIKDDDICLLSNSPFTFLTMFTRTEVFEQWLLIFSKNHPYLEKMISMMTSNILNKINPNPTHIYDTFFNKIHIASIEKYFEKEQYKEKILRLTGPDAFSVAIKCVINDLGYLHRSINYNKIASIAPNGRPMYDKNNKHYSTIGECLYV